MTTLLQIGRNTFRETLREPVFLLVLLSAMVLISLFPGAALFVFREHVKLVVDSSMATVMVFGWIAAVLCASHTVAREIDNGTALLVLSKPVNRPLFIVGKLLGILGALTVFCFLTAIATLVSVRIAKDQFRLDYNVMMAYFAGLILSCVIGGIANFVKRSSFSMATVLTMLAVMPATAALISLIRASDNVELGYQWQLVPALILVMYAVWAMGTLAVALSTRLEMVSNLLVCSVIFVVGLMSDYLIGRYAETNWALRFLYGAVPNWQLFWMADALAAGKTIPAVYVGWCTVYILVFVLLFTCLAIGLFADREVGCQIPTV